MDICSMSLLVVSATELEIAPFLQVNKSADFLITGIGIASTTFHLTKQLLSGKYDLVIQAGIAGTFTGALLPGDVVIVKKDTFGDLGIYENNKFHTLFETGLESGDKFPFENGWLNNYNPVINTLSLTGVTGITVNTISESLKNKQQLEQKFHSEIESMEGAVLHYVCLQMRIPFLQIRGISNQVGVRDKSKWQITLAIKNLNYELQKLILNNNKS